MRSPFPGMDPYLESPYWPDFHDRLINSLSEVIAEQLPAGYDTQIRERVYLVEPDVKRHRIEPDVAIDYRNSNSPDLFEGGNSAIAGQGIALKPVTLPLLMLDPSPETYIEIEAYPGHEVVAVVEIFSPSNKSGRGRVEYLDKRDELIRAPVHLVEIDILLGGSRIPLGGPLPAANYYTFVSASNRRPSCDVYARNLADARGRYHLKLDYGKPPKIPIPDHNRQWVSQRVLKINPSNQ